MNGNVFAARPVFRSTFTPPQHLEILAGMSSSPGLGLEEAEQRQLPPATIIKIAAGIAATYVGFAYGSRANIKEFEAVLGWLSGIASGISTIILLKEASAERNKP